MLKFSLVFITILLAVALAEPRVQLHRGLTAAAGPNGHPYLFLRVPRGNGGADVIQGFEVLEEEVNDNINGAIDNNDDDDDDDADGINDDEDNLDDDDDDEQMVGLLQRGYTRAALSRADINDVNANDDDDDDDENDDDDEATPSNMVQILGGANKKTSPSAINLQKLLENAKPTQMMVSKEHAGAIMVPDGVIEIEGQSIIDEKTGKPALLVPREALDVIPDGSVVALMERSAGNDEEERANRVIVRRRRRGSRRNVRRRGGNNNVRRRRVNNNNNRNKRRRVNNNRRKNVRVVRVGGNNNNQRRRRRNNNRRRIQPVVIQG